MIAEAGLRKRPPGTEVPLAYDRKLAERVRLVVDGRRGVTEKAMFGGLAFLLGGYVFVGPSGVEALCRDLVERAGVLLAPASLFRSSLAVVPTDRFRVGVGRSNPEPALEAMQRFLERRGG